MKKIIRSILLIVNWLAIVALLLAYLAPFVNPQTFWPVSFFGLVYKALLFGFILITALGLSFKTKMLVRNLIVLAIGLPFIFRVYAVNSSNTSNNPDDESIVKIASFNSFGINGYKKRTGSHQVNNYINNQNIDIANLLEWRLKALRIDKSQYPYQFSIPTSAKNTSGILFVSKFPIINSGLVPFTQKSNNVAGYIDVRINNKIVRFYTLHLETTRVKSNDYHVLKKLTLDSTSTYKAKNMAQRIKFSMQKRARQVEDIKKHMKDCPYPSIIMGDLNDTPQSFVYQQLIEGKNDAFVEVGRGFEATYLKPFPFLRIDFILVDKSIECVEYQSTDSIYSDHKLIFANLKIK